MLPTKFRFIWQSGFRGEYLWKSANQKQELPMAAMFVNGSGQNEQSLERTFHRCFLPSFTWFGWGVSEEKIEMWKVNGRQTTDDGQQVMAKSRGLWQVELKWEITPSRITIKLPWWCFNLHMEIVFMNIGVVVHTYFCVGWTGQKQYVPPLLLA
jgi:hypothetical protein